MGQGQSPRNLLDFRFLFHIIVLNWDKAELLKKGKELFV